MIGYGVIASPFTNMLKKKAFIWSDKSKESFAKHKEALISPPVLQMPNFDKKICYRM